jgi:hypothetical protein
MNLFKTTSNTITLSKVKIFARQKNFLMNPFPHCLVHLIIKNYTINR